MAYGWVPWEEIESSAEYQELSDEEKEQRKLDYYNQFIQPLRSVDRSLANILYARLYGGEKEMVKTAVKEKMHKAVEDALAEGDISAAQVPLYDAGLTDDDISEALGARLDRDISPVEAYDLLGLPNPAVWLAKGLIKSGATEKLGFGPGRDVAETVVKPLAGSLRTAKFVNELSGVLTDPLSYITFGAIRLLPKAPEMVKAAIGGAKAMAPFASVTALTRKFAETGEPIPTTEKDLGDIAREIATGTFLGAGLGTVGYSLGRALSKTKLSKTSKDIAQFLGEAAALGTAPGVLEGRLPKPEELAFGLGAVGIGKADPYGRLKALRRKRALEVEPTLEEPEVTPPPEMPGTARDKARPLRSSPVEGDVVKAVDKTTGELTYYTVLGDSPSGLGFIVRDKKTGRVKFLGQWAAQRVEDHLKDVPERATTAEVKRIVDDALSDYPAHLRRNIFRIAEGPEEGPLPPPISPFARRAGRLGREEAKRVAQYRVYTAIDIDDVLEPTAGEKMADWVKRIEKETGQKITEIFDVKDLTEPAQDWWNRTRTEVQERQVEEHRIPVTYRLPSAEVLRKRYKTVTYFVNAWAFREAEFLRQATYDTLAARMQIEAQRGNMSAYKAARKQFETLRSQEADIIRKAKEWEKLGKGEPLSEKARKLAYDTIIRQIWRPIAKDKLRYAYSAVLGKEVLTSHLPTFKNRGYDAFLQEMRTRRKFAETGKEEVNLGKLGDYFNPDFFKGKLSPFVFNVEVVLSGELLGSHAYYDDILGQIVLDARRNWENFPDMLKFVLAHEADHAQRTIETSRGLGPPEEPYEELPAERGAEAFGEYVTGIPREIFEYQIRRLNQGLDPVLDILKPLTQKDIEGIKPGPEREAKEKDIILKEANFVTPKLRKIYVNLRGRALKKDPTLSARDLRLAQEIYEVSLQKRFLDKVNVVELLEYGKTEVAIARPERFASLDKYTTKVINEYLRFRNNVDERELRILDEWKSNCKAK